MKLKPSVSALVILFISVSFTSNAMADYASHQFHYMEMELSKCKEIAYESAKKIGFKDIGTQDVASYNYSIVYGMDKEGYSFQYTCEPKKGFGYLIINGPRSDKRTELRDNLGDEIKKRAKIVSN